MGDKVKIRSKMLKFRDNLNPEEQTLKNKKIAEKLESLQIFKKASHVLFYYSVKGEVDTLELIERNIDSKQLYLPVIQGKSHFQAIPIKKPLELKRGFEGIPEPILSPTGINDEKIELVITPGVAFDKKGNRIGMGKGYYDRYFQSGLKSIKIGLAYEEQILDSVPKDPYDEPVDLVVTDQNIYQCNHPSNVRPYQKSGS